MTMTATLPMLHPATRRLHSPEQSDYLVASRAVETLTIRIAAATCVELSACQRGAAHAGMPFDLDGPAVALVESSIWDRHAARLGYGAALSGRTLAEDTLIAWGRPGVRETGIYRDMTEGEIDEIYRDAARAGGFPLLRRKLVALSLGLDWRGYPCD